MDSTGGVAHSRPYVTCLYFISREHHFAPVFSNSNIPLAVKVDDLQITYRTTFERGRRRRRLSGFGGAAGEEIQRYNISFNIADDSDRHHR